MPSLSLLRIKALPWTLALQAAFVASQHWRELAPHERTRLLGLIRKAHGWPANLTKRERHELRALADRLDFKGMGQEMLPLARGRRKKG